MAPLASAERDPARGCAGRDEERRAGGQSHPALTRAALLAALLAELASAGCGDDSPVEAGPTDAALDAALDAGPDDEDSGSDEDAGADAGSEPEKIIGDDYTYFPELTPEADGELVVRFGVPSGARSFALTVVPKTARRILLVSLHGPGDELLFDGLADEPTGPLARATTNNLEPSLPFSMLYPNTPEAPFGSGIYRARFYLDEIADGADPAASVDIVLGRPIDEAEPRALGLQLWVVAGASRTAEDLVADDKMLSAFATLRAIFEGAGIEVPDIGLDELGSPADELAVIDGDDKLLGVLDALAGYPGRGVHIVFVDRIDAGQGKTVLGKTTGIPVPPAHNQLDRRGAVVIALETLPNDSDRIAELIAHETGHALGLRHTSEADGERHDPLRDTPECPSELATFESTSGQLLLTAEDCEDLDGNNLMFYTQPRTDFSQQLLSDDQVWVLARNPSLL